jgi:hypothetical protein
MSDITINPAQHLGFKKSLIVKSAIQGGNFWQGFAAGALSSIAISAWQGGSTAESGF